MSSVTYQNCTQLQSMQKFTRVVLYLCIKLVWVLYIVMLCPTISFRWLSTKIYDTLQSKCSLSAKGVCVCVNAFNWWLSRALQHALASWLMQPNLLILTGSSHPFWNLLRIHYTSFTKPHSRVLCIFNDHESVEIRDLHTFCIVELSSAINLQTVCNTLLCTWLLAVNDCLLTQCGCY